MNQLINQSAKQLTDKWYWLKENGSENAINSELFFIIDIYKYFRSLSSFGRFMNIFVKYFFILVKGKHGATNE